MPSDRQLMTRISKGCHAAFAELVRRHTDRYFALTLRTLGSHSDAEDALQTAFIKLWQRPQAWHAEKAKFTTWFYRVVLNTCHDLRRQRGAEMTYLAPQSLTLITGDHCEQSKLQFKQQQSVRAENLAVAMAQLPRAQQDALNMVVYSELPQKQVAEVMGISLKALESLLFRAKQRLAKQLSEAPTTEQSHSCQTAGKPT